MEVSLCAVLLFSVLLTTVSSLTTTTPKPNVNCSTWRSQVNEYGPRVFMVGDRSFVVPNSVDEIQDVTCPRIKEAGERLRDIFKSCLRPFPRTLAALVIRRARRTMRTKCNDRKEKALIMHHLSCLRPADKIGLFHDVIDEYSRQLVHIQGNVAPKNMLDVACCMYIDGRKHTREIARRFCDAEAVTYAVKLIDDLMQEAMDLACSTYIRNNDKCIAVKARDPLPSSFDPAFQPKDSFLLNLIDLLTMIGDNE